MDDEKRLEYDNENIYTDKYFKKKILGIEFDWRNLFW